MNCKLLRNLNFKVTLKQNLIRGISSFFVFIFYIAQMSCSISQKSEQKVRREVHDSNLLVLKDDSTVRKRILVLPFLDQDGLRPQSVRDRAREIFLRELNKSGPFLAMSSEELQMDVMGLVKVGEYDLKEISKRSVAMGVPAILEGKIMDIRVHRGSDPIGVIRPVKNVYEVVARVKVLATHGGSEIFNTEKTVRIEEQSTQTLTRYDRDRTLSANETLIEAMIRDAFLEFIPQIDLAMSKIGWEGRVAAVSGDRIYVNVGKISGLQIGDLLKVSDEGEEVFDPEHGNFLGKVPGRLKGTLEVISYFGKDGAIAIVHSGSGFKENDRVELY